ncbi:Undecaprenyl-diphosphatase [hydrothermal vent metagenome]|uniref:Undecaprenyl-diphosphatase n=1 Tax=hydrothermal vent metagenome TaxID=652676 RepID=A0A3B1CSF8_9ZZZZ
MENHIGPFKATVLGIIQGVTEYLPVSSSGHLVIAQNLFGLKEPELFFDIVLHIGTLAAVIWYYRKDIFEIVSGTMAGIVELKNGAKFREVVESQGGFRLMLLVIIGVIPTGLIGIVFKDDFERMFASVGAVGVMLIITGAILFITRFTTDKGRGVLKIHWWEAFLIGVAQGLAITPGISRSGATISLALFFGIGRETAARYSFLIAIPAILGALVLKFEPNGANIHLSSLLLGFGSSMVVGYLCLVLLVALVKRGRLSWFSYYCFLAGGLTLAYL